jgi:hypothetical protein
MNDRRTSTHFRSAGMAVVTCAVTWGMGAGTTQAQMPVDQMNQMPTATYPMQPATGYGTAGAAPPPGGNPSMKQLFAGTVAAVLQTTGVGVAGALTGALTGAIQNWFNRPPKPAPNAMSMQAGGGMNTMPGSMNSTPGSMNAMPDSMNTMPAGSMGTMPGSMNTMPPTMPTDTSAVGGTVYPAAGSQAPGMPMPAGMASIYAGVAYEVQVKLADGTYASVDPAVHSFSTGERFTVLYRPSLPGQVLVMNVNPLGVEKQIDAVNVAAGELARLGPYEFRDTRGAEQLRLILQPCRTDALLATTRDIVKVDENPPAAPMPGAMPAGIPAAPPPLPNLAQCGAAGTRDLRPQTRDIVKVEADGSTLFALDPVSATELSTGQVTPREVTILLQHR